MNSLQDEHLRAIERQEAGRDAPDYEIRDVKFALEPKPPADYIVQGLLETESVAVVYGKPGGYKSWSMLALAVQVARGKPWLEFPTKQVTVLYFDEETGENKFSRRLQLVIKGVNAGDDFPMNFICLSNLKLDDPIDEGEINFIVASTGARLVIFDTLAKIMTGDENSKMDVQPVFNALKRIADKNKATIVVIHHPRKDGGYRGSSAIEGSADLMIEMKAGNEKNHLIFETTKMRDVEYQKFAAIATITEDGFTLIKTDAIEAERVTPTRQQHVLDYLMEHGESDKDKILYSHATIGYKSIERGLREVVERGQVVRTNPNE